MSSCDKDKPVSYAASAAMEEHLRTVKAAAKPPGPTLLSQQDYINLLRTGFDDLFEVAINPEGVMRQLRAEIDVNKPIGVGIEGPIMVDGCIHMTLVRQPPVSTIVERMTVIVYPEGDHEVRDDEVSQR